MRLLCKIFGHKWKNHRRYVVTDEYAADSKDCVRCKTRWWMHERKDGSIFWVEDGAAS